MNRQDQEVGLERQRYLPNAQSPFNAVGNIQLFFAGGDRGRILERAVRCFDSDEPLFRVCGERGSGKTLLSLVLADRLADRHNIIRIDQADLDAADLLRQLTVELCPALTGPASSGAARTRDRVRSGSVRATLDAVRRQLATTTPGDRPVLLIIDSPTTLDAEVRSVLDALTEVRRDERRVLQVAWFERVGADASARDGRATRLAPRPGAAGSLDGAQLLRRLTLAEISDYLQHHMLLFDYSRRHTFTREMAYFIADRSDGVYRAINAIARNAFTIAQLEGFDRPTMSHLLLAGMPPRERAETRPPFVRRHRRAVFALFASSVVASVATLVLLSAR